MNNIILLPQAQRVNNIEDAVDSIGESVPL